MSLQEIKKSSIDEPTFDEKVLLATHAINWFAIRTEKIHRQLSIIADKVPDKVHVNSLKDWDEMRADVLKKLQAIMEDFGNFIDGRDANDPIDGIVTEPLYDIVYERYQPE